MKNDEWETYEAKEEDKAFEHLTKTLQQIEDARVVYIDDFIPEGEEESDQILKKR
ncbi:hypothetical protein MKZ19_07415 [Shouchella clausii]|uniref:hypothetical protein n=1 Tax=Shouchella clausii TaxID=79880 RepID=UPI0031FCD443